MPTSCSLNFFKLLCASSVFIIFYHNCNIFVMFVCLAKCGPILPVGSDSSEDWTKFCPRVVWQNLVRSSLPLFPWLPVGSNSREDWSKFCQRMSWQNLVRSSLPSFPWLPVGSDSREDWTKFCPRMSWQNLVQSSLLGSGRKSQQRGLAQILPGNVLAKFGPMPSAVISLVTGRK